MTEREKIAAAEAKVAERMLFLQQALHAIHESLPALPPDRLTEAAAAARDAAAEVAALATDLAVIARDLVVRGQADVDTKTLPLFPDKDPDDG